MWQVPCPHFGSGLVARIFGHTATQHLHPPQDHPKCCLAAANVSILLEQIEISCTDVQGRDKSPCVGRLLGSGLHSWVSQGTESSSRRGLCALEAGQLCSRSPQKVSAGNPAPQKSVFDGARQKTLGHISTSVTHPVRPYRGQNHTLVTSARHTKSCFVERNTVVKSRDSCTYREEVLIFTKKTAGDTIHAFAQQREVFPSVVRKHLIRFLSVRQPQKNCKHTICRASSCVGIEVHACQKKTDKERPWMLGCNCGGLDECGDKRVVCCMK